MGSFYTNITLRTAQTASVVDALKSAKRQALVAEPQNDCTVVYDRECEDQDIEVLKKLAGSLSAKLKCAALALLIHDDDVLIYSLHENGKLVDEYVSWPAFADDSAGSDSPDGGDAELLCRAFGAEDQAADVEEVLRVERAGGGDEGFVFETERHQALVDALGLPGIAVSAGYNYVEQGELPEGTTESSFTRVG